MFRETNRVCHQQTCAKRNTKGNSLVRKKIISIGNTNKLKSNE